MDTNLSSLTDGNHFLGIQWHWWKAVGWLGNGVFFSRFFVQWYATEKRRQVVVPSAFWWLSIAGSMLLLAYAAFYQRDSVFIFAYAFTWIPYIRNLMIHYRAKASQKKCVECGTLGLAVACYCHQCGAKLSVRPEPF